MPNGRDWIYKEGDTLTHEVGHWLNLAHTHDNGCNGVGDYMDDAGGVTSNERTATYSCDVGLDNCRNDGGANPIHSFMSYVEDSCMTEFSAGQALRMQAAYEIYRYDSATSKQYSLAADGYSCSTGVVEPTTPKVSVLHGRMLVYLFCIICLNVIVLFDHISTANISTNEPNPNHLPHASTHT